MLTKPEAINKVSKSLAHFMSQRNITKEELAKTSGVQLMIIEDLLGGKPTPAISDWYILYRLSKHLDCLVNELIEGPVRAIPAIRSQADLDNHIWRRLSPERYNIFIPEYVTFGPLVKMIIHVVKLDPTLYPTGDPKKKPSRGKHFWLKDGRYVFTYNSIVMLSHAAGISWELASGVVESRYDKNNLPQLIRYQAYGSRRNSQGVEKTEPGTYEWNHAVDVKSGKYSSRKNMLSDRQQYAVGHAETGAMSRAFYRLLGFPEKSFTAVDIQKPFIIPEYVLDLDPSDPDIKKRILDQAFNSTGNLFGNGNGTSQSRPETNSTTIKTEQESEPPSSNPQEQPKSNLPATDTDQLPTYEGYRQKWFNATAQERGKHILELCALGGGASKDFATPDLMEKGIQMYHIMQMAAKTNPPQFKVEKKGVRS